jgi:hypothetical protein
VAFRLIAAVTLASLFTYFVTGIVAGTAGSIKFALQALADARFN